MGKSKTQVFRWTQHHVPITPISRIVVILDQHMIVRQGDKTAPSFAASLNTGLSKKDIRPMPELYKCARPQTSPMAADRKNPVSGHPAGYEKFHVSHRYLRERKVIPRINDGILSRAISKLPVISPTAASSSSSNSDSKLENLLGSSMTALNLYSILTICLSRASIGEAQISSRSSR